MSGLAGLLPFRSAKPTREKSPEKIGSGAVLSSGTGSVITREQRVVYDTLRGKTESSYGDVFATGAEIASRCGLPEQTVLLHLACLIENGFVRVAREAQGTKRFMTARDPATTLVID
jgi:DNA-binding transcriptional ArsR family regulator